MRGKLLIIADVVIPVALATTLSYSPCSSMYASVRLDWLDNRLPLKVHEMFHFYAVHLARQACHYGRVPQVGVGAD